MLLTLLVVGLSACGPVPRPYKQSAPEKAENELLVVRDAVGVTVAPPAEAPSALAGPLADLTAARLRARGVPASTGPNLTIGYLMQGVARWRDGTAHVSWHLTDRKGARVAIAPVSVRAARVAFEAGSDALIESLARRSAAAAAATLTNHGQVEAPDDAVAADGLPPEPEAPATVHVLGVATRDGTAVPELSRALEAVLADLDVPRADAAEDAGLLVQGAVALDPADGEDAGRRLAIDWWLMTADGTVVASLAQENRVAGDPVANGFGPVAYDIALPVARAVRKALRD